MATLAGLCCLSQVSLEELAVILRIIIFFPKFIYKIYFLTYIKKLNFIQIILRYPKTISFIVNIDKNVKISLLCSKYRYKYLYLYCNNKCQICICNFEFYILFMTYKFQFEFYSTIDFFNSSFSSCNGLFKVSLIRMVPIGPAIETAPMIK